MSLASDPESFEVVLACDGPGCQSKSETPKNESWILVEWLDDVESAGFDFCGWDCVIRFGSRVEPNVVLGTYEGL